MRVLAIETSCDETAAAVVDAGPRLLADVVHSQVDVHAPFGGVVPEVAAREHVGRIDAVVAQAVAEAGGWEGIAGLAVTRGPGLAGPLLVGLQMAKGLALGRGLPWVGVHHLEGHLCAAQLSIPPPTYPHLALLVSGGHTQLIAVRAFGHYAQLGGTCDDAAGEAFDKSAKLLGLGYPGGAAIEAAAAGGDPGAHALPRGLAGRGLDLSFSGLKTAVAVHVARHGVPTGAARAGLCAALQEAIVDVLAAKAVAAARRDGLPGIVLAGGVAANGRLRALLGERCAAAGLWLLAPPRRLCTDNAAMIAAAGRPRLLRGERGLLTDNVLPRWPLQALAGTGVTSAPPVARAEI